MTITIGCKKGPYHRKKRYGLLDVEFQSMIEEQGGLCGICAKPMSPNDTCVDHDHRTGKIRGLLHRICNTRLGLWESTCEDVESMKEYLNGVS